MTNTQLRKADCSKAKVITVKGSQARCVRQNSTAQHLTLEFKLPGALADDDLHIFCTPEDADKVSACLAEAGGDFSKLSVESLETRAATTTAIGKPLPVEYPPNFCGVIPLVESTGFSLYFLSPDVQEDEIRAFKSKATFIAINEGPMCYLAAIFGDEEFGADTPYTIHSGGREARTAPLPKVEELVEGEAPMLICYLIDSASGIVKAIRPCCPPGFTIAWLKAIYAQRNPSYDDAADTAWIEALRRDYPTVPSLALHPRAVVGKLGGGHSTLTDSK